MTDPKIPRSQITLTRTGDGTFKAMNSRGGEISIRETPEAFTPVELLLAGIAGCSAIDVDIFTTRRSQPTEFEVECSGQKVTDGGNRMEDIEVRFHVRFPEGPEGDAARDILTRSITNSRDRLCTVSRTVQLGAEVTYFEDDQEL